MRRPIRLAKLVAAILCCCSTQLGTARGGFAVLRPVYYKHVWRHFDDVSFDSWLRCADPVDFLQSVGYDSQEIQELFQACPHCLESNNVHSQLAPKVRFLVETLGGGSGALDWKDYDSNNDRTPEIDDACLLDNDSTTVHTMRVSNEAKQNVPSHFFTLNLDRAVAPKHAYLVYHNILPHGTDLLYNAEMLHSFLNACTSTDAFCELCNEWSSSSGSSCFHSVAGIDQFCQDFGRGLLPACQKTTKESRMVPILVQHGANHLEHDAFGLSPLQWACGSGHVAGVESLLEAHRAAAHDSPNFSVANLLLRELCNPKDGATLLHWAGAGLTKQSMGHGGSYDVCQVLLQQLHDDQKNTALMVNARTYEGRTPAMWAAWSNSVPILDLLKIHGADLCALDDNNRHAGHFASAAGHVEALEYLRHHGLDVSAWDATGRTPLDYARLFDRESVIEYLSTRMSAISTIVSGKSNAARRHTEGVNHSGK